MSADLVFDLDGTICDPIAGIGRCINFALGSHGFDTVSETRVARLIGPPLDDVFRSLLPEADDRLIVALIAQYRERYAQSGYAESEIYQGIAGALASLTELGLRFGVCTSKRADFAEKILERFGILDLFSFVDGGDTGISKTQQLNGLLKSGLVDNQSKMIGDRAVDILAAKANGLGSVAVLWGYGTEAELAGAAPEFMLRHVEDLMQLVLSKR